MDIALLLNQYGETDFVLENGDLLRSYGYENAVLLSLFTDRRADADDRLPGSSDPRGWWGELLDEDEVREGSRLWLLSRSKSTKDIPRRAEAYAKEALEWMVEDEIAREIAVRASALRNRSAGVDWLLLDIEIKLHDDDSEKFLFEYNWQTGEYGRRTQ